MFNNNKLAKAIKLACLVGTVGFASVSVPAFAQEGADEIEKIEITGSRIKRTDMETASPVQVIGADEIRASGAVTLDNVLQQLTVVSGANVNAGINNGSGGDSTINLRGLGANRTLVLVNGRRMINSGTGASSTVDLNSIPASLIERIEVLKDGASAIYGADAVAGVVNVILRQDVDGVELDVQSGISAEGDAEENTIAFNMGGTYDKGHFIFGAQYTDRKPAGQADRDFSDCPIFETNMGEQFCAGSSYAQGGHVWGDPNHDITPTGADGAYAVGDSGYYGRYVDSGEVDEMGNPIPEFMNHDGIAEADLSGRGGEYHDFGNDDYFDWTKDSFLRTPMQALSLSFNAKHEVTDEVTFITESLYTKRWSDQQMAPQPIWNSESWFYNPQSAGGTHTNALVGHVQPGEEISYGRRMVESGPRKFSQNVDTFRFVAGLEGFLANDWDWSLSYVKGKNDAVYRLANLHNMGKINQAVLAGEFDPFAQESWSPENVQQFIYTEVNSSGTEMDLISATLAGDLMDTNAGTISFAAGLEHRTESAYDIPDSLTAQGLANDPATEATAGEYTVDEAYAEFVVPVLEDVAFADKLEVNAAVRYFDYDTFGSDSTWKLGLAWKVTPELLIRSVASTAFRAPSVSELYGGKATSFEQINHPATDQTQAEVTVGGNINLTPEEADIFTLGIVAEPIDNLAITVDYYDIEVTNAINTVDDGYIADLCLGANGVTMNDSNAVCQSAGISIDQSGRIKFNNVLQNLGGQNVAGVDITTSYSFSAAELNWNLVWNTALITKHEEIDQDGNAVDYKGLITGGAGSYPEIKSNFKVGVSSDNWDANYELRYIDGMDSFSSACQAGNVSCGTPSVSTVVYHDVSGTYYMSDSVTISGGINNLFDKQAPYFTGNNDANTDPYTYDTIGRYFYVRAGFKF